MSDQDVFAGVIELSNDYHAPSTSLITLRRTHGAAVSGAFQSAVRAALERLRAAGQLSCVTRRGTHHWSPTSTRDAPLA